MATTRGLSIWSPEFPVVVAEDKVRDEPAALPRGDNLAEHLLDFASKAWPNGATWYCPRCRGARPATMCQMARYIDYRVGLPKCCGETMHIGDAPSNEPDTN